MQGVPLIVAFILTILIMVVAISKFKIHPFLSIMGVSMLLALIAGIPLVDVAATDTTPAIPGIVSTIGAGFSATFTSIGIVIILGALIGALLEKSGAAIKMADCVVKAVGPKHPDLAILIMGWIVSICVFCDSGFVLLNPIRKSMVQRTKVSSVTMTVALSMGLYTSHCLFPPTPGPIAAANALGIGENLLLVMCIGMIVSIPALIGTYFFAKFVGKRVKSKEDEARDNNDGTQEVVETYEQYVAKQGKLPSAAMSFAPIIVPILLMALSSICSMAKVKINLVSFLGSPIMALTVGVLIGIALLGMQKKMDSFYELTNNTLKLTGPILFITAAGSVLGRVIANSGLVPYITSHSTFLATMGLFFPFLLAAILKSAQGSSTVSLTTTAGIVAPLMGSFGFTTPSLAALTVVAIGAGAMTVSHANDSYFWVATNLGEMKTEDGYKTHTLGSLVVGICSMIGVCLVYVFLK